MSRITLGVFLGLVLLPVLAFASLEQADLNAANLSGTGGCNPGTKFDPNIPKGQTDSKGLLGLIGLGCIDPTSGQAGTCVAANECKAVGQKGEPTPQQLQQANNGNTANGTTQATEGSQTVTQTQQGSATVVSSESQPSVTSGGTTAQTQSSQSYPQSILQSAMDYFTGGNPNPLGQSGTLESPGGPAWLSGAQVNLQSGDFGQASNSVSQTGQTSSSYQPAGGGFSSLSSQPMGSLEGLTTVGNENSLASAPPGDVAAQDLSAIQAAAKDVSSWVDSTFAPQGQTPPQIAPQETSDVRTTIYVPGGGGNNGGLLGSQNNYLDPSVPTVAAGLSSGYQFGQVLNISNPSTGQSVNAVVGDVCPACGTGIDLTPAAANPIGFTLQQGVGTMQVGVVADMGSYTAGAQLAASLNTPSDPWSSPGAGISSTAQFASSLYSQGLNVNDFAGYASAQAYLSTAPSSSYSALAQESPGPLAGAPVGQVTSLELPPIEQPTNVAAESGPVSESSNEPPSNQTQNAEVSAVQPDNSAEQLVPSPASAESGHGSGEPSPSSGQNQVAESSQQQPESTAEPLVPGPEPAESPPISGSASLEPQQSGAAESQAQPAESTADQLVPATIPLETSADQIPAGTNYSAGFGAAVTADQSGVTITTNDDAGNEVASYFTPDQLEGKTLGDLVAESQIVDFENPSGVPQSEIAANSPQSAETSAQPQQTSAALADESGGNPYDSGAEHGITLTCQGGGGVCGANSTSAAAGGTPLSGLNDVVAVPKDNPYGYQIGDPVAVCSATTCASATVGDYTPTGSNNYVASGGLEQELGGTGKDPAIIMSPSATQTLSPVDYTGFGVAYASPPASASANVDWDEVSEAMENNQAMSASQAQSLESATTCGFSCSVSNTFSSAGGAIANTVTNVGNALGNIFSTVGIAPSDVAQIESGTWNPEVSTPTSEPAPSTGGASEQQPQAEAQPAENPSGPSQQEATPTSEPPDDNSNSNTDPCASGPSYNATACAQEQAGQNPNAEENPSAGDICNTNASPNNHALCTALLNNAGVAKNGLNVLGGLSGQATAAENAQMNAGKTAANNILAEAQSVGDTQLAQMTQQYLADQNKLATDFQSSASFSTLISDRTLVMGAGYSVISYIQANYHK